MAFLGHEVVHNGEDSLLHLTGVLGAEDDHLAQLEVQRHCGVIDHIGDVLVGSEFTSVEDIVVSTAREIPVELGLCGSNQHVGHEEGVVGAGADDSDLDSFIEVPAGISVHHV